MAHNRASSSQRRLERALRIGGFTGSVANGASCNCALHSLAPHCHGTHTECIGHVTRNPVTVASLTPVAPCVALVVSVQPEPLGAAAAGLPDVIRAAPVPFYNRFDDVWRCVDALHAELGA